MIAAANEYMAAREVPVAAGEVCPLIRAGTKDQEAVIALALKKNPTLTPAHAEALRKLFAGPTQRAPGRGSTAGCRRGASFPDRTAICICSSGSLAGEEARRH